MPQAVYVCVCERENKNTFLDIIFYTRSEASFACNTSSSHSLEAYQNYSCACVRTSVCPSVTEGQQKSVDHKSKASASLDRTTRRPREGCH